MLVCMSAFTLCAVMANNTTGVMRVMHVLCLLCCEIAAMMMAHTHWSRRLLVYVAVQASADLVWNKHASYKIGVHTRNPASMRFCTYRRVKAYIHIRARTQEPTQSLTRFLRNACFQHDMDYVTGATDPRHNIAVRICRQSVNIHARHDAKTRANACLARNERHTRLHGRNLSLVAWRTSAAC